VGVQFITGYFDLGLFIGCNTLVIIILFTLHLSVTIQLKLSMQKRVHPLFVSENSYKMYTAMPCFKGVQTKKL